MLRKTGIRSLLLCCLAGLTRAAPAPPADLTVLSVPAVRAALERLAPAYEKSAGHKLHLTFAPAAELQQRIAAGARFDVALLPAPLVTTLTHPPLLREPRDLARAGMGIAMRSGTTQPAPRNAAQLRELLLRTGPVAMARAGACGERFLLLLENLGVAEQIAPKLVDTRDASIDLLAAGRADLAIAPIGEITGRADVALLAPWPLEVQCYQTMAGAVSVHSRQRGAARAFLHFIATEADAGALRERGQEPLAERSR
ncbi:MAG: bacterial extracellular solute-binding family protein [Betaproteobacteria bacterium]|nr:bacterial extracellular solute-binding family protein [Betaproteobacteria bacterium]